MTSEWMKEFVRKASGKIKDAVGDVVFDADLRKLSTMRIGGKASCVAYPSGSSIQEVEEKILRLMEICCDNLIECYPIGNGSNTVFGDVHGVIICTRKMNRFWIEGETIRAQGGAPLPAMSAAAKDAGLSGLEFAIGIPGTIGGAVARNASNYLQSTSDVVVSAKGLRGIQRRVYALLWKNPGHKRFVKRDTMFPASEEDPDFARRMPIGAVIGDDGVRHIGFGYRQSTLTDDQYMDAYVPDKRVMARDLLYSVELGLEAKPGEEIARRMKQNRSHRARTQPRGSSVGSVFKRRANYSTDKSGSRGVGHYNAEELIDRSGCETGPEGWREGDVYMAEQNPNFFINAGNGTLRDFLALRDRVRGRVRDEFGIELQMEADVMYT